MRVVFMGTPDFAVGTLRALVEAGHDVVGVFTQPDKPKGRGKAMQPTPVKEAALEYGIPVYQPRRVREPEVFEILKELAPEVIVVVAFGQIIPQSILDLPPYGCINVHASLLPKYRGAAPIQWAVIDGEDVSGVTIMKMDAGIDTGDMISKVIVPITKEETGESLFDKLSTAGAKLLMETLPSLADGTAIYEKQPAESPTPYAAMIKKELGDIDWNKTAVELERLIRGLNSWPSAYTKVNGKTLKIWKAEVVMKKTRDFVLPGTVLQADAKGFLVQTGQDILSIQELQLEGKKRMEASAFLRGYSVETGSVIPC